MKKIVMAALSVSLIAATAQQTTTPPQPKQFKEKGKGFTEQEKEEWKKKKQQWIEEKKKHQEEKKKEHETMKTEMKENANQAFDKIGLSEEQKAKSVQEMENSRKQIEAVHQNKSLTKEQKEQEIKAIKDKSSENLTAIMGSEKFAAWKKEMRTLNKEDKEKYKGGNNKGNGKKGKKHSDHNENEDEKKMETEQ